MLDAHGRQKQAPGDLFEGVRAPGLVTADPEDIDAGRQKIEDGLKWLESNPQWKGNPNWRQVYSGQQKKKLEV